MQTNLIPSIGQAFKVTFARDSQYSFYGVILSTDKTDSDREFKIQQTKRIAHDVTGRPYTLPDSIIEVEKKWFNTELTGRKISIH